MFMSLGREVRVLKKKGGRGDISFYINIPKEVQYLMGNPEKYRIKALSDRIVLWPIRDTEVKAGEVSLNELQKELEMSLQDESVKSNEVSCTEVVSFIDRQAYSHDGIMEVITFCLGNKHEHTSLVKYNDGTFEIIKYGLSCGYGGTSPGTLVQLISYLTQRPRHDPKIEFIEKVIKSNEMREGAIKIEVNTIDNKIVITPIKQ